MPIPKSGDPVFVERLRTSMLGLRDAPPLVTSRTPAETIAARRCGLPGHVADVVDEDDRDGIVVVQYNNGVRATHWANEILPLEARHAEGRCLDPLAIPDLQDGCGWQHSRWLYPGSGAATCAMLLMQRVGWEAAGYVFHSAGFDLVFRRPVGCHTQRVKHRYLSDDHGLDPMAELRTAQADGWRMAGMHNDGHGTGIIMVHDAVE